MKNIIFFILLIVIIFCCCSEDGPNKKDKKELAAIVSLESSGSPGDYTFSVGIRSPDTGCEQYADWWEVISEKEDLVYRRILTHSHVNEQPFVRSGGPVQIQPDDIVIIRAHMNTSGYGIESLKGSINNGFEKVELDETFAIHLANRPPQPDDCAF